MLGKHFQFTLSAQGGCGCRIFKFEFMQITSFVAGTLNVN